MREEMRNKLSKHRDLSPRHTCGQVSLIFTFSFFIFNLFACAPDEPAPGNQETRYNVIKGSHAHGDFTISPTRAAEGKTVTLTPEGDDGYVFSAWQFDDGATSAADAGSGKWTFKMPASDIVVSAIFIDDPNPVIDGLKIGDTVEGKGVLVWRDEFIGDSLDTGKWNYDYGNGSQYGPAGWGNSEKVWYMARNENVRVADGKLIIEARNDMGGDFPYSSGKITTKGTRNHNSSVTYPPKQFLGVSTGCVEARIKAPRGAGFWPAFWMLGANVDGLSGYPSIGWPRSGEIDIFEMRGDRMRNGQTLHYQADGGHRYSGYGYDVPDMADNFHVYGVVWNDTQARFYCDGALKNTVNYSALAAGAVSGAFHDEVPWVLIINLSVGGNYVGGNVPAASVFEADAPVENRRLTVDWVRVYE